MHIAAGAALVTGLAGGNALGGAAGAGIASIAAAQLNKLSDAIAGSNPTGSADMNTALGNIVANAIATGAGAAVGRDAGAFSGYNVDRFNRQLHPDEQKWIKDNAAVYAKQQGITIDQAIGALTAQADRQVQNGSAGAWDQNASAFLGQAHGMLPADGNSGPGYMFYATPDQKANPNMYAGYYPNGVGLNQPAAGDVANSVNRDAAYRDAYTKGTIGAALLAGGIAVAGPIAALPGAPIFSAGGALGSGAWASPAGTGAISAGINAGSQYYQNGTVNPVDVAIAAISGGAGAYGGLGWNVFVNGVGGATGTAINNALYGKSDSITGSAFASGVLSSLGYGIGKLGESGVNATLKPGINTQNWASTGSWSSSGWNLFNPNTAGVIGGTVMGGMGQETAGTMTPTTNSGSQKK
jgi:hypothetical protein